MKKFAKVLALVLAVIMVVFAFAGCGESKDTDTKEDPSSPVEEEVSGAVEAKPAKASYIIYSDNSFAPFEYLDTATNTYIGVDMDILAAVAEDQGFTYTVANEGFDASLGAVQSGQADGMIAGMTINDKRKLTFDFSEGYFEDGQILVVPADSAIASFEDLNGKTLAVKAGTASLDYAESIKEQYGFETVVYEGSPEMYQAVLNGINDACMEDNSVIGWAIKSNDFALKTVGDVVNPCYYGFAVKKGENPELIAMFNAGLANIKADGTYDTILAKYGY